MGRNSLRPILKGGTKLSVYKGDFLGFQLGDEHSYNLNITRVSSDNWYNDTLSPNFNDEVISLDGVDGTYYFGTSHTSKQMQIDFAFDKLTDEDFRNLRRMFGYKGLKKLILDEAPYKYYMVRPTQPPILSYICFDEPYSESETEKEIWTETKIGVNSRRVYKGEGSVQLIAYYPYARAIKPVSIAYNATGARILNQGDLPAPVEIIYNFSQLASGVSLSIRRNGESQGLTLNSITPVSGDVYLLINSYTQLLEGLDSNRQKTGNLYNKFIASGDFFQLPQGLSTLSSSKAFLSAEFTPIYY